MNADVIPQPGGFLIVQIDHWGYMRNVANNSVVHRETRDLHRRDECLDSFAEAKTKLPNGDFAILELTSDGGGAYVWLPQAEKEKLEGRLRRFRSCYGGWPTRALTTKNLEQILCGCDCGCCGSACDSDCQCR